MAGIISDSDSIYSNQENQTTVFIRDVIVPTTTKIKRAFSRHFGTPIEPDLMEFLSGDLAKAAKIVKELAGVWDRATALRLTGQKWTDEDVGKMYSVGPSRSDESMDPNRERSGDETNE